jgi:AcrR family transcriptional regulator
LCYGEAVTTTETGPGRRERKKAATHQALADAALRLFLDRGYDNVTVREIADAADVSTTTLLKHFPSKEALVFDRDSEVEASLIAAVENRPSGSSLLSALRAHTRGRIEYSAGSKESADFMKLVHGTPALVEYWHKMWMRHEHALARAIAADLGVPETDPRCAALAHLALETSALAQRAGDPVRAVDAAFDLLEHGWRAGN